MRRFSFVTRLTFIYSIGSGVILVLLAFVLIGAVSEHFEMEARSEAIEKAGIISELVSSSKDINNNLIGRMNDILKNHRYVATRVYDNEHKIIYQNDDGGVFLKIDFKLSNVISAGFLSFEPKIIGFLRSNVINSQEKFFVVTLIDLSQHDDFMRAFIIKLMTYVTGCILISSLLGFLAARKGLSSIKEITSHLYALTANSLTNKVVVSAIPVEIEELYCGLNSMLDRLDGSFSKLASYGADLAHELKGPISNLRMQTEVILRSPRNESEYIKLLESNLEEYERLSKTVTDMLFIAKAESGIPLSAKECIDARSIAVSLAEYYQVLADEKRITIDVQGETLFEGEPLMIRRAISNLLSNAIRYTPPEGLVKIALKTEENASIISVLNTGNEIPVTQREKIFSRFYRTDDNRLTIGHEGYGLGLAIVKAIVSHHSGVISISRVGAYNVFEVRIPTKL